MLFISYHSRLAALDVITSPLSNKLLQRTLPAMCGRVDADCQLCKQQMNAVDKAVLSSLMSSTTYCFFHPVESQAFNKLHRTTQMRKLSLRDAEVESASNLVRLITYK